MTQCLSTPVRDKPGSLLTENGGHGLLPSPLSPIPHTEAQTRALAHPRRRTREIRGDYNPAFWKNRSQARTDVQTHGRGTSAAVNTAVIKQLQFRVSNRSTHTVDLPSDPGNHFHWSCKEHVVLTHQTTKHVGKQEWS